MERAGEGEASRRGAWAPARPFPTRTIWPGGGRGGLGVTPVAPPDPLGSAVQPRPSSRRAPEDSQPSARRSWIRGALGGCAPSTPRYFIKGVRASFQRCGDHVFAPRLVQGRGSWFPLPRCSWGDACSPAKIVGLRREGLCFPRYPDAGSPGAPPRAGEGVSNLSFRPGASLRLPVLPPSCSGQGSHISHSRNPWSSVGHPPRPPFTRPVGALWRKWDDQAPPPGRSLPSSLSNPRRPGSRMVNLHLGVFVLHLPPPPHPTPGGPLGCSLRGRLSGEILEPASNPQDDLKIPPLDPLRGPGSVLICLSTRPL